MAGLALADGAYLGAFPRGGASTPAIALALGVALGWLRPHDWTTFTYSVAMLALMVAVSELGAGLGAWLWLGWVVGDFVLFHHPVETSYRGGVILAILRERTPLVLSYLQLAVLVVLIPLASGRLRAELVPRKAPPAARPAGTPLWMVEWPQTATQCVVATLLTYSWTVVEPMLIRPVFVWPHGGIPVTAIASLQQRGWSLAIVAAATVIGRMHLEEIVRTQPPLMARLRMLLRTPDSGTPPGSKAARPPAVTIRPARRLPVALVILLRAAAGTLFLAGLAVNGRDAVILASMLVFLAVESGVLSRLSGWTALLSRVPMWARLAASVLIAYLVGRAIIGHWWDQSETFLPMIGAMGTSLFVTVALLADRGARAQRGVVRNPPAGAGAVAGGARGVA